MVKGKSRTHRPIEQRAAIASANAARLILQAKFSDDDVMKGFLRACAAVEKVSPTGNKRFDEAVKAALAGLREAVKALQS